MRRNDRDDALFAETVWIDDAHWVRQYQGETRDTFMRLDRFDLNLLVALDALLEERNVTRAAERLHIGQSAASSALARLREYFGDELLTQVGRELRLTPVAHSLVEPVRDTLLRARATIALRPQFDPATTSREFNVCASDYVVTVLMAAMVQKLATLAPGITIHLQGLPRDLFESFERGSIDLLVMPEQYCAQLEHPRTVLFGDDHVCIAWTGNTQVTDKLTIDQYLSLGHVSVRFGLPGGTAFEEWLFPQHRDKRRVETSVDQFSLVPQLVVGTQRLAVIHRRLAEQAVRQLPLRILEVPIKMPVLTEMLCWPRYVDNDPAHRWLRETLLEHAASFAPCAPL